MRHYDFSFGLPKKVRKSALRLSGKTPIGVNLRFPWGDRRLGRDFTNFEGILSGKPVLLLRNLVRNFAYR